MKSIVCGGGSTIKSLLSLAAYLSLNQIPLGAFRDKSEYVGYIVDYPELKGGIGLRNK